MFESSDSDVEAMSKGGFLWFSLLQRKIDRDVAGSAVDCDRPLICSARISRVDHVISLRRPTHSRLATPTCLARCF